MNLLSRNKKKRFRSCFPSTAGYRSRASPVHSLRLPPCRGYFPCHPHCKCTRIKKGEVPFPFQEPKLLQNLAAQPLGKFSKNSRSGCFYPFGAENIYCPARGKSDTVAAGMQYGVLNKKKPAPPADA